MPPRGPSLPVSGLHPGRGLQALTRLHRAGTDGWGAAGSPRCFYSKHQPSSPGWPQSHRFLVPALQRLLASTRPSPGGPLARSCLLLGVLLVRTAPGKDVLVPWGEGCDPHTGGEDQAPPATLKPQHRAPCPSPLWRGPWCVNLPISVYRVRAVSSLHACSHRRSLGPAPARNPGGVFLANGTFPAESLLSSPHLPPLFLQGPEERYGFLCGCHGHQAGPAKACSEGKMCVRGL